MVWVDRDRDRAFEELKMRYREGFKCPSKLNYTLSEEFTVNRISAHFLRLSRAHCTSNKQSNIGKQKTNRKKLKEALPRMAKEKDKTMNKKKSYSSKIINLSEARRAITHQTFFSFLLSSSLFLKFEMFFFAA